MDEKTLQERPCRNLRSHDMYFHGAEKDGHDYASGAFWCLWSQQAIGPDGGVVDAKECNSVRACFKG